MNQFYAFVEETPLGVPILLCVIFLAILVALANRVVTLRRELRAAPDALAQWNPDEKGSPAPPICTFAAAYLLSTTRLALEGWPEERLFSSRGATDIFEEYAERRLSTVRFVVGSTATGIALFFTFFLIAHVIGTNIPSALDAASAATADTEQLKTAMKLLGQKFMISATGIMIAVIFAIGTAIARRFVLIAAHEASLRAAHLFCTPESVSASAQLLEVRAAETSVEHLDEIRETMLGTREDLAKLRSIESSLREMGAEMTAQRHAAVTSEAHLAEIRTTMAGTREDLAKLRSIEVSVKGIGADLTLQLQRMLKEDLGEQIKEILIDVMRQANEMSERLRAELLDGFQRTLETEIPKVLESLQAIRNSVEGQASSPIERMLEQLQSVVSGGMQGETAQMSAALKQFAEVVPALASQLQDVAKNMTRDMQERTDESARVSEKLLAQVGGLLERLESQQSATDRAIAEIAKASSDGAEAMMARLQAGSAEVMGGLLKTSRSEIDGVLARLQDVAKANAQGYGTLEQSVGATARSIGEARDGLAAAAESIRSLSKETRVVVAEARQGSEAAQKAASSFESAAGMLRTGVDGMRTAIEQGRTYGTEQQAVVAEHRRMLKELELLWPKLFDTYLRSFDEKSILLTRSWNDLYTHVSKLSQTVGADLSEATEDLKTSVDNLAAINNGRRA